jgi:hypothetical protein
MRPFPFSFLALACLALTTACPGMSEVNVKKEVCVTLPEVQAAEIKQRFGGEAKGWGSIKVRITIGDTSWATSLFPASSRKSYLFAVKADVRKAEAIREGDTITATVHIL